MPELEGFPFFEVRFNKAGALVDPNEVTALSNFLGQQPITDLIVLSHGWNNDMDEARTLYRHLLGKVRQVIAGPQNPLAGSSPARRFAVLGVLWPSKRFAEGDLIPGGAAAVGAPVSSEEVKQQIDELRQFLDNPQATARLEEAKALVATLPTSATARRLFAEKVRSALSRGGVEDDVDGSDDFFQLNGETVLDRLSAPPPVEELPEAEEGGGAAGLRDLFGGVLQGARNLLNLTTYYEMKERAGDIGRLGLFSVLRRLHIERSDLKLHLVGHSFGSRLVTAAAAGRPGEPAVPLRSMVLIQAAFSHYGFADNYEGSRDGFFRSVLLEGRVQGPILVTHTANDRAVGLAYPLASLIANQVGSFLGGPNDKFGGLGRNGARKTPEAIDEPMRPVGGSYAFQAGRVHNLLADTFIADHSAIANAAVAYAILAAIATT